MASLQLSERYHLQAWGRLRKPLHILPRSPERCQWLLSMHGLKTLLGLFPANRAICWLGLLSTLAGCLPGNLDRGEFHRQTCRL
jgi:hypothetical protein